MSIKVESYFGGCPICGKEDGFLNVGRNHWFYCAEHKTKWIVGFNLFSSWRNQTEDEQRRIYAEVGMGGFREVEPLACTELEHEGEPPEVDAGPCPF
jgi:hypothetical protein